MLAVLCTVTLPVFLYSHVLFSVLVRGTLRASTHWWRRALKLTRGAATNAPLCFNQQKVEQSRS